MHNLIPVCCDINETGEHFLSYLEERACEGNDYYLRKHSTIRNVTHSPTDRKQLMTSHSSYTVTTFTSNDAYCNLQPVVCDLDVANNEFIDYLAAIAADNNLKLPNNIKVNISYELLNQRLRNK